jgi:signal transduction histidine kinase/ligand-binding sensor domain-containing protein
MKKFFLLLFFLAFSSLTQAQLYFEKIKGLSQNTVYSITKDSRGFMWVGTADGLNRFDGVNIKIYKPALENKKGNVEGIFIRSRILEDSSGLLWFANESGTFNYNPQTDKFKSKIQLKIKGNMAAIYADPILQKNSHVWLANSTLGVFGYDIVKNKTENFSFLDSNKNFISSKGVYDNKNKLWFAEKYGIAAFDIVNKKWQFFKLPFETSVVTYCNDTIWFNDQNKIYFFSIINSNYGEAVIKRTAVGGNIQCLYTDAKKSIWAGDYNGNIYCKKNNNNSFEWKGNVNADAKTMYPVYCLFIDESENLWAGTDVLGLLKTNINDNGFHTYPSKQEVANKSVFISSICEESNNKVWIGTYQQGVFVLDKEKNTVTPVNLETNSQKNFYKSNVISLIKKDTLGNFWIGYSGQLFVKEKNSNQFLQLKIPLPPNCSTKQEEIFPKCLVPYNNGWLISTTHGLYFLQKKKDKYGFDYIQEIGQSRLTGIWINPYNNNIWLADEGSGFCIYEDFKSLRKPTPKVFKQTGIKYFLHDAINKNIVWIATLSGLVGYDLSTGKYKFFSEAEGIVNTHLYGIIQYKNELWISTNGGLAKAEINYGNNISIPQLKFSNYTTTDGLPDNEFNGNAFCKGENDNFYFGTIKGLVWFDAKKINTPTSTSQIHITNLLVNENLADSTLSPEFINNLSLPYNKNNLFFEFRRIEYNNPEQVNYAYQLEGWDKDWINNGTTSEVRYSNLTPGTYTFKIKATNSSGNWNNEIKKVTVVIHSPFWETWWFYSSIALVVIGGVIIITRFYAREKLKVKIAQLQKQHEIDKERQRISREMHDDIGSGLTQIALMSDAVKRKNQSSELNDISETSRRLISSMSEIVWSLNPENKTLQQLYGYMREQLHKLLEHSGIDYTIKFPDEAGDIILENSQSRNILLITKEIVHNAVKYSKAKHISISCIINNKILEFEIKDDGVGFNISKQFFGSGLKNIRSRIEQVNGTLAIDSKEESGTVFKYSIPL